MSDGGKGSGRRPTKVAEEEFQKNWDTLFPPKQRVPYVYVPPKEEEDGKSDKDSVHP